MSGQIDSQVLNSPLTVTANNTLANAEETKSPDKIKTIFTVNGRRIYKSPPHRDNNLINDLKLVIDPNPAMKALGTGLNPVSNKGSNLVAQYRRKLSP